MGKVRDHLVTIFPFPVTQEQVFAAHYVSPFMSVKWLYGLGLDNSEHGLRDAKVQQLINSDTQHFDLIVSEQFFQDAWLLFAHKFNAPIVTIATTGYADYMDYAQGLMTPWAYVPHFLLNYDDQMDFLKRCENVLLSLYDRYVRLTYYMPENNRLARTYFNSLTSECRP